MEEGLTEEHPVIQGLRLHLSTTSAHAELSRLSKQFGDQQQQQQQQQQHQLPSSRPGAPLTPPPSPSLAAPQGFEVYLEEAEDSEDDLDLSEDDLRLLESMDAEEMDEVVDRLQNDQDLRLQLLRHAYQGCDLVASGPL